MKKLIPAAAALLPMVAFAETETINSLIIFALDVLAKLVPVIIAIAVILFLWGVVGFITAGDDKEKRDNGRNMMVYGIIGLFVMVAVWGLVNILGDTFNLNKDAPKVPEFPTN